MKEEIKETIKQVLYNPQASYPPISYEITDKGGENEYSSRYIDIEDFLQYLKRLEKQLNSRIDSMFPTVNK